jgi:hypothetical protein
VEELSTAGFIRDIVEEGEEIPEYEVLYTLYAEVIRATHNKNTPALL